MLWLFAAENEYFRVNTGSKNVAIVQNRQKIHAFLLVEPDLVRLLTIALYDNEYREQFMLFVLILSQEVSELRS